MNADGDPTIVCWNCVKGRHAICEGRIPETDEQGHHGKWCECPVCHANRYEERQPEWDAVRGCYYDPGPHAEPRRERG